MRTTQNTHQILQIASSFTSLPIARTLQPLIVSQGLAGELGFIQYGQMTEYLLGPASDADGIVGTIVLLRVEDWLRDDLKSSFPDAPGAAIRNVRDKLRSRVNEFVDQLDRFSRRGKPVWFLACPSSGWLAERFKLEVLCKTYTDFLVARVQGLPQVTLLRCPALLPGDFGDRNADRLGQIPFTTEAFRQLGGFVGEQVVRTFAGRPLAEKVLTVARSQELGAYLEGLRVHVRVTPAKDEDRVHVDRLLRTAAAFSLNGENPDLSDGVVNSLLETGTCLMLSVSDRFSDFGPSGLVAFRLTSDSMLVDWMALSCPVLGKQVEFAALSALARVATELKATRIIFEFTLSGRNQPMLAFLQLVANADSKMRYVLPVELAEARLNEAAVAPGAWSVELPSHVTPSTRPG